MNRGTSSAAEADEEVTVTAGANASDVGLRRSSRVRRQVQAPFNVGFAWGGSSARSKATLADSSVEDGEESHLDQVSPGDGGTLRMCIHPCAAALMQFHVHLAQTEVIGYLGGFARDDGTVHVLEAFPAVCVAGNLLSRAGRSAFHEVEMDPVSDVEVRGRIVGKGLNVVGWYHSHPDASFTVAPSKVDIQNQLNYQNLIFKGTPFVAAILAPCNEDLPDYRGDMAAFYVVEGNPVGVPCVIEYGHAQGEECVQYRRHLRGKLIPDEALEAEAINLILFYSKFRHRVHLSREWRPGMTFLEKLRACLQALLPAILDSGCKVAGNTREELKSWNNDGNVSGTKAESGRSGEFAPLTAIASIAVRMGPVSVDDVRVANEQLALLFSGLLKMADEAWDKPPNSKKGSKRKRL